MYTYLLILNTADSYTYKNLSFAYIIFDATISYIGQRIPFSSESNVITLKKYKPIS